MLMTAHMLPERLAPLASPSLCYASLYEGQVEVATDFVADANRVVHFILAAANCGDRRRGVIVRRLLEIETYRSLALLGLPVARQLSGRVQVLEHDLSKITRLSVEAGRQVEDTGFRLAATQAYGDILANRLERLGERSLGESTTIIAFNAGGKEYIAIVGGGPGLATFNHPELEKKSYANMVWVFGL